MGNILLKDEGVGVHIVHEIEKLRLPQGVKALDAGVAGFGIIHLLEDASKVIFIDAMEMGGKPGDIMRVTPHEVRPTSDAHNFSLHEPGLLEVLELARDMGKCSEIVIFGIQPGELGWGMELSPELKRAVPEIIKSVLREINSVLLDE